MLDGAGELVALQRRVALGGLGFGRGNHESLVRPYRALCASWSRFSEAPSGAIQVPKDRPSGPHWVPQTLDSGMY